MVTVTRLYRAVTGNPATTMNAIIDSLRGVYRSALLKKGIAMGPALAPAVER